MIFLELVTCEEIPHRFHISERPDFSGRSIVSFEETSAFRFHCSDCTSQFRPRVGSEDPHWSVNRKNPSTSFVMT